MPSPIDSYRSGYEKAKTDRLGGVAAEITMGMLRDDPGGHFAAGYRDGAAGNKFNPPLIPTARRRHASGLIPKFSENPLGWFLAVIIGVELWVLWQLIKAPFELIGGLLGGGKPSAIVVVKNVILVVLVITLIWFSNHAKDFQDVSNHQQSQRWPTPTLSPSASPARAGKPQDVSEGAPTRPYALASSTLKPEPGHKYDPENVLDGRLDTVWAEGVPGYGEGQWIQIVFPTYTQMSEIAIFPGLGKNEQLFRRNGRPKTLKAQFMNDPISFDTGRVQELAFTDEMRWQVFPVNGHISTFGVRLTIVDVYKGTKYEDTAISEIRIR